MNKNIFIALPLVLVVISFPSFAYPSKIGHTNLNEICKDPKSCELKYLSKKDGFIKYHVSIGDRKFIHNFSAEKIKFSHANSTVKHNTAESYLLTIAKDGDYILSLLDVDDVDDEAK